MFWKELQIDSASIAFESQHLGGKSRWIAVISWRNRATFSETISQATVKRVKPRAEMQAVP